MTLATLDADGEKALRLPVGVTSPLWLMIGSAAVFGAAMFWATRWMRATPEATPALLPRPEPEVQAAVEKIAAETLAPVETLAAAATPDMVVDPVIEAPVAVVEAVPEAVVSQVADDLTKLSGIGAKLAASLAERGVTRFAQIAAWTDDEIAALDKDMKLMGRIGREAWVAQAKQFAQA